MEKLRSVVKGRRYLFLFLIVTIISGPVVAYSFLFTPESNIYEPFHMIHDFGNYYSVDMEVTYYGSFLVAATNGLIEVGSDSSVSSIPSFTNLSVRDIEIENNRDKITHGVIAYIASDYGISVLYRWGERRQDLNLSVDAERALGFNPHRLALSPSGQYLYIYDSVNGVYSVDLDNLFYFADQRFIPELLNESTQSWPFDYSSPMNGVQLTHMVGTNEGILLGGESGLFFFNKTSGVWSNTTLTHQTTALEVECLSYMPFDRTIFVGIYGGIERFQITDNSIVSTGEVLLPEHEWDAIYAIEYDFYFNRLYAGSPNGLYIFFFNNDTNRFFPQEQAQWTGFSIFSIGTIQTEPSSIYFSTLSECYIVEISVPDEPVPNNYAFENLWIPILGLVIGVVGLMLTAINTYYRRESVELQKESIKSTDSSIQCTKELLEIVKEAKSFMYGRKIKSSSAWETQHKKIEDNILRIYEQCGKSVPSLGEFIKQFRNCMVFDVSQFEGAMSLADQIMQILNDTINESL